MVVVVIRIVSGPLRTVLVVLRTMASPYFFFVDWLIVVLGLRRTAACVTNLPVMALRPRLPEVS